MSVTTTIHKVIERIKNASGTYDTVYRKTLGELVECADGTTVENKVGNIKGIANNLLTTTTGLALDATQGKLINDNLAKLNFVKIASVFWQAKTDNYQEICFRVTTSASVTSAYSESTGTHYANVSFTLPAEITLIDFTDKNFDVTYEGGGVYNTNIVSFNATTKILIIGVSRPTAFTNQAILFNVQMKFFK